MKSLEANKTASLWFRVDGAGVSTLELGNDAKSTTTDWMKHEVVLDVPEDALTLTFGFILNGSGKLWGDDFRLEIVDADVSVTGPGGLREQSLQRFLLRPEAERLRLIQQARENAKRLPLKPINMDFEQ